MVIITLVELLYYFYIVTGNRRNPDSFKTSTSANQSVITKNILPNDTKNEMLSESELSYLKNTYYSNFFPLGYDSEKNLLYINFWPKEYVKKRQQMGIDFASWMSLANISTKDVVVSSHNTTVLQGTIAKIDAGDNFQIILTAPNQNSTILMFSKNSQNKVKYFADADGKQTQIDWKSELHTGDRIRYEETVNLMKPPTDPSYIVESKIVRL